MEFCFSCGMPINDDVRSKNKKFCKYCADESGTIKSREDVQNGIANWLRMMQPELAESVALNRALYYLKAMPHWADA